MQGLISPLVIEHGGKKFSHFEDGHGNMLHSIDYLKRLDVVFFDGTYIRIVVDPQSCAMREYKDKRRQQ